MLNWKNLAALSVVCVLGTVQARADVVVSDSTSELRCGELLGNGRLEFAESRSGQASDAVGFDLNYRSAPLTAVSDFSPNQFRNITPVAVDSPVASTQTVSAFGYSTQLVAAADADRALIVTPIPPAGAETEPVSTFGVFTQRWKRSSGGELNGSHVNADARSADESIQATIKSSGMPLIGYTTVSASLMGLMFSACRRGRRINQIKR